MLGNTMSILPSLSIFEGNIGSAHFVKVLIALDYSTPVETRRPKKTQIRKQRSR